MEETKSLRFDGAYRSAQQAHIRYEDGERKEEEYYLFYQFYPDGTWICKTIHTPLFRMDVFLGTLDIYALQRNPHLDEPVDSKNELFFQSGTYSTGGNMILVEWRNSLVREEPLEWKFRIISENELETELGEYKLRFIPYDDK